MRCWVCDELAHGVCRFCGRAVCKDHAKRRSFLFEAWVDGDSLRGLAVPDALFCGVCNPRKDPVDLGFLLDEGPGS
jgi:hypothetical protein